MALVGRLAAAALVAAGLAWVSPAAADCLVGDQLTAGPSPLLITDAAAGPTTRARGGRMVAPVMVNGQGPFRFIVDTGANRSVLSQDLANRLGLTPIGSGEVHSVHEVTTAPLVNAGSLAYGPLAMPGQEMPLLEGAVLAGEQGLLGVDGMRGRRLRLDFERKCIEILPSDRAPRLLRDWTVIEGQLRFGHLVLIPGRIRGQTVNLFIDTGSDISMANVALREQLRAGVRTEYTRMEVARAFTAGTPIVLDTAVIIPRMTMGEVEVTNLVAFVGNYHIFDLWGLRDEPTLLIGMDVLSQARAIAIDYERATVHFRLNRFQTGSRLRQPGQNR